VDRINEMLTRLSELSEGDMSDLEGTILSEFKTVEQQEPTADVVETMTALADALDAVRGEQTSRAALHQELTAKAAEASARVQEIVEVPLEELKGDEEEEEEVPPIEEEVPEEEEEPKPEDILMSTEPKPAAELASNVPAATESVEQAPAAAEASAAPAPAPEPVPAPVPAAEAAVVEAEAPAPAPVADPAPVAAAEASTPSEPVQTATPIEENPVAASATDVVVKPPADAQVTLPHTPVSVTAGADIPGKSAGSDFSDLHDVSEAFVKRLHALRRVTGGDGEQHIVASIHADYPEERTLYAGSAGDNWEKIRKITSREALVAAITCYPLETQFNLFGVGSADRPVRDSLAVFNADRGGLRYYSAPTLAAIPQDGTGPVGVWKQDQSVVSVAGASLSGVKPCYTVVCSDEKTALLEAVSLCLTFDNLAARANPENVARHNELALIFHARATELATLGKIKAGGTAVTAKNYNVGAAREFFAQVDGIASAYRYKYRLGARDPLRAIAPLWFRDMIRADLAMQMPGDGLDSLGVSQAAIDGWFRERNINVTWSLDSVAAAPVTTTGAFNATVEWDLFAEGTWLYLDGGTLDIGVIRDSTLVGSNDYKTFTEEFTAVALIGDESLHVTSTVAAAGAAAALEDNYS
jgi:hypothetical protein